eukprot:scaffold24788_cov117-Cylindrotheca_fusiformis.AAC.2
MDDNDFFGSSFFGDEPDWTKDDDEEEDGANGGPVLLGAQHVLLLIDCDSDMFRSSSEDDKSAMDLSLQLAKNLLQECIRTTVAQRSGKRNSIGIVLFNTKLERAKHDDDDDEDEDMTESNGVHTLMPLVPPGISHVHEINKCLEGERNLQEEFEGDKTENLRMAPLQQALTECNSLFKKAKSVKDPTKPDDPVDSKSIWIFTSKENPYSSELRRQVHMVAEECHESGVQIVVWPLMEAEQENKQFDQSLFFESMCQEQVFEERLSDMEQLQEGLEDLRQCWKKVRRAYHGPMRMPDWRDREDATAIMVDWFKLVQFAKKPSMVQIDLQTKLYVFRCRPCLFSLVGMPNTLNVCRETVKVSNLVDDNGDIIASFKRGNTADKTTSLVPQPGLQRIRQFADFGGELIPLSQEELSRLRRASNGQLEGSNLVLLGFKSVDSIPFYHLMDSCYLIYPQVDSNDMAQENAKAFANLHASMLRKKVVGIGEVLFRVGWSSKLVAVYPQEEELDDEGAQRRPPGFVVSALPFEDDVRELEMDEAMKELRIQTTLNEKLEMKDVKTEEGHVPTQVSSNVDLNEVTGYIASEELVDAAMGLVDRQRLDEMELGEDFDNAALEKFFNYIEAIATEDPFFEEKGDYDTELDDAVVLEAAQTQIEKFKDLLPEDTEKPKAVGRKRKAVEDDSGLNWQEMYENDELDSCRVPELKKYLRSAGLLLSGNKKDILLRVKEHIKQELVAKKSDPLKVKKEV